MTDPHHLYNKLKNSKKRIIMSSSNKELLN